MCIRDRLRKGGSNDAAVQDRPFLLEMKKGKGRREFRAAPLREWIKKYP